MTDTKLHIAVRSSDENRVLECLRSHLDPNEIGLYGWSPVHEAAHNGERDILKLLILYNGNVNKQDDLHQNTPLHYAAKEDNSACVTVLLKAGARVDVKNDQSLTCLDVATPLCVELIEKYMSSYPPEPDWKSGTSDPNNNPGKKTLDRKSSWDSGLPQVPDKTAIGFMHLSFEYHRENLKIRVWQLSDLLLPPPQTSMIESVFVKGYFIPDSAKKTLRQTEDIKIDKTTRESSRRTQSFGNTSIQHIFSPSSFRFETPLLYTKVNQQIVNERSLQLEVCMTQKGSRKSFLMAMVHMPLRIAVRRPIREKYPLIPCMNYTIPNNMKIYSARDIIVEGGTIIEQRLSRSNSTKSTNSQTSPSLSETGKDVKENYNRKHISVDRFDLDSDKEDLEESKIKSPFRRTLRSLSDSDITIQITSGIQDGAVDDIQCDISSRAERGTSDLQEVISYSSLPGSTKINIADDNNSASTLRKKKIIPNELNSLKLANSQNKTFSVEIPDNTDEISTSDIKDNIETVVDISDLQTETVIDIDDTEKNRNQEPNISKLKKIIPNELTENQNNTNNVCVHKSKRTSHEQIETKDNNKTESTVYAESSFINDTIMNRSCESGYSSTQSIAPSDFDDSPKVGTSDETIVCVSPTPRKHRLSENDRNLFKNKLELTKEFKESEENRGDTEMEKIFDAEMCKTGEDSSTPVSRPETPVWDFYDFTEEEEHSRTSTDSQTEVNSPDDTAGKESTLQKSLERLRRPQAALDTCLVAGPVLPSVVLEDFDIEED